MKRDGYQPPLFLSFIPAPSVRKFSIYSWCQCANQRPGIQHHGMWHLPGMKIYQCLELLNQDFPNQLIFLLYCCPYIALNISMGAMASLPDSPPPSNVFPTEPNSVGLVRISPSAFHLIPIFGTEGGSRLNFPFRLKVGIFILGSDQENKKSP